MGPGPNKLRPEDVAKQYNTVPGAILELPAGIGLGSIKEHVTGGRKGQKAERYDLVPDFYGCNEAEMVLVESKMGAFWRRLAWGHLESVQTALGGLLGGWSAMRRHLARVYGFGALKYGDNNWQKGYPYSWAFSAFWRHWEAYRRGEMMDDGPEGTGAPHLACCWFHVNTLRTFVENGIGTDDRPVQKEAK